MTVTRGFREKDIYLKKTLLILALTVTILSVSIGGFSAVNKVLMVYPDSPDQIAWIAKHGGSIEEFDPATGGYRVYVPQVLEQEMVKMGISFDIIIDDVKEHVRGIMSPPTDSSIPSLPVVLDHYLTYPEMQTFLTDLQAAHSNIMSIQTAAVTSSGNHELYLIKISDNVDMDEDEPELLFEGQIHGDEIAGYILNLHMIEYLVTNYGTDPTITALVDDREIYFLPATNSDGTFSVPRSRYNYNSVDCNRDSGYMWHHAGGSSEPFGENETKVLFDIWRDNQFVFHSSWHSGTTAFLYAWSCHNDPTPDDAEHDYLGQNYCSLNTTIDSYYQGSGLYGNNPYHGSTKDSAYGIFGAHGWSIELTQFKQCAWAVTEESINANTPSIIWLLQEAGYGIKGMITDDTTSNPVPAVIDIDGKWVAYNDPAVGNLHRYLRPGLYNITIWTNGYAPVLLSDISVMDSGVTDISTTLTPDETFGTWAMKWLYNFGGNDEVSHLLTHDTLGPVDDEFYSIGYAEDSLGTIYDAYVVLDLGPEGITDQAGDDLFIYEGHNDGDETIKVYCATEPFPLSWTYIGTGLGDCSFDIGSVDMGWIRYVKIVDQHLAILPGSETEYDGYDLDAVGKPFNAGDDDDDDDDDNDDDDTDTDDDDINDDDDNDDDTDSVDDDDDKAPLTDSDSSGDDIGECCG